MPRKVLAAIVEHAGMLPGENEPTNIIKDLDPQLVIPETAAEEMGAWRVGERGDCVDLVPVIMQGLPISKVVILYTSIMLSVVCCVWSVSVPFPCWSGRLTAAVLYAPAARRLCFS